MQTTEEDKDDQESDSMMQQKLF